jgi:hypothetical protein
MVIQGAELPAVHAQPVGEPTFTVPLVTLSGTETLAGERVVVQGAPACVTVTVCPATVIVPERMPLPGLAAIDSDTLPLPLPEVPPVTVIHAAELTAVQAHPAPDVTETAPVAAGAETDRLVVERVNVHGTPACVTVNVWPATLIVAVRAAGVVLAATL